ncbi:MAG TPA: F0F1 ATP synthase subunit A [Planctomycetota bacterium]|nr:F0F1 ATP synthase subunit A [Planctomycetota bacterium]
MSARAIAALAVVLALVALVWPGFRFVRHHHAENSNAFVSLYMHLMPAHLERNATEPAEGGHAAKLVSIELPAALSVFDMDVEHPGVQLVATTLQVFQLGAVILIFVIFGGVVRHLRSGGGDWLTRIFTAFAQWVRDDMVFPTMGKDLGTRFLPFFLTLFFFVLFMNLLGLVPGGVTATANVFVTAALASLTLISMLAFGMIAQGPVAYWKNLVPHVPAALWPLMFVVELFGVFVKPAALMIRLFANMTAGHLIVLSFMAFIFYFAGNDFSGAGYAVSLAAVPAAVFIMIIETFVAMLQAFIFTQLSILFVQASIHPQH